MAAQQNVMLGATLERVGELRYLTPDATELLIKVPSQLAGYYYTTFTMGPPLLLPTRAHLFSGVADIGQWLLTLRMSLRGPMNGCHVPCSWMHVRTTDRPFDIPTWGGSYMRLNGWHCYWQDGKMARWMERGSTGFSLPGRERFCLTSTHVPALCIAR